MPKTKPPRQQDVSLTGEGKTARWYCVSQDGRATLCAGKHDALENVASQNVDWPRSAPHRAVQLVDVAEVDRLRYVLAAIEKYSVSTLRTNSKDRGDWAKDVAFMGKLARGH